MSLSQWKSELVLEKPQAPIAFDATNAHQIFVKAAIKGDIMTATKIADAYMPEIQNMALIALIRACQGSHTPFVKWIIERFRDQLPDALVWESAVLRETCRYGDFELLQVIITSFNMHEIKSRRNPEWKNYYCPYYDKCEISMEISTVFDILCKYGNLIKIQYLIESLSLFEWDIHNGFIDACRCNPEIAEYFLTAFTIEKDMVDECDSEFVYSLGSCKNLKLIKKIIDQFKIPFEELREHSLRRSFYYGNYEFAKYLAKNYAFTWQDLTTKMWYCEKKPYNLDPFTRICQDNRLDIAEWLIARFDITPEIFRKLFSETEITEFTRAPEKIYQYDSYVHHSIYKICKKGNLDAVKWYVKQFNITPISQAYIEKIELDYEKMFMNVCKNGHIEVAKWMIEFYPIKALIYRISDKYIKKVCKRRNFDILKFMINNIGERIITIRDILIICNKKGYLNSGQDLVNFAKLTADDLTKLIVEDISFSHLIPA
jgi:hypothetical protein